MKDEPRNFPEDSGNLQTLLGEQTRLADPSLLPEEARGAEGEAGPGEAPAEGSPPASPSPASPPPSSPPPGNSAGGASGNGTATAAASSRRGAGTGSGAAGSGSGSGSGNPGARKAAVFILSLDEEDASRVLRGFSDDEMGIIVSEIAKLGVVEQETVTSVMKEFRELEQLHSLVREGGMDKATRLMERSCSPERAQRVLHILAAQRQNMPFVGPRCVLRQGKTHSEEAFRTGKRSYSRQ